MKGKDEELIKTLNEEYGSEEIAAVLSNIVGATVCKCDGNCNEQDDLFVRTLTLIQHIEGWRIRAREIHWSTRNDAEHTLTDEIIDVLDDAEDKIAEVLTGAVNVHVNVGDVKPIMTERTTTTSLITEMLETLRMYRTTIKEDDRMYGMKSIINKFIADIDQKMFKSELS